MILLYCKTENVVAIVNILKLKAVFDTQCHFMHFCGFG